MFIKKLRINADEKTVYICIDNGGKELDYTVSLCGYEVLGEPKVGDEVDDDLVRELSGLAVRRSAVKKALGYLSFSDKSEKALYVKLVGSGYSREVSRDTVNEMIRLGYINEERTLERLITDLSVRGLFGPLKIISKLVGKGYSPSLVKRVYSKLILTGEIDPDASVDKLIDLKLPKDHTDKERYLLLKKYGYQVYPPSSD